MWSAAHDDDEEFRRRYAGDPERVKFMLTFYADNAEARNAVDRLELLTSI